MFFLLLLFSSLQLLTGYELDTIDHIIGIRVQFQKEKESFDDLNGNGQWGSGISRSALDLTGNSGWAEAGPNDNLKAQEKYSIALWFKSSGSQQGWTQILAKRQDVFSPYFVQFDEGGDSIKVYHRFQADYVNSGTFSINHGVWNHLASTFDGQKFKSYLNLIQKLMKCPIIDMS